MRTAIGGFGLTVFAVTAFLTPFAIFADWPTPAVFLVLDAISLFAWGQAVEARSNLGWRRTFEWLAVFVVLMAAVVVWFLFVAIVSRAIGQSLVAIVGYSLFVVGLVWLLGWVMGHDGRARAFLALRRAMMGRGSEQDLQVLAKGPRTYL